MYFISTTPATGHCSIPAKDERQHVEPGSLVPPEAIFVLRIAAASASVPSTHLGLLS